MQIHDRRWRTIAAAALAGVTMIGVTAVAAPARAQVPDDLPGKGLAVWYVSSGTYVDPGHDDIRLVDFSKPDQDPDQYNNPGANALFTANAAKPKRTIFGRNGQWNLLWFQNVSAVADGLDGLFLYAEF